MAEVEDRPLVEHRKSGRMGGQTISAFARRTATIRNISWLPAPGTEAFAPHNDPHRPSERQDPQSNRPRNPLGCPGSCGPSCLGRLRRSAEVLPLQRCDTRPRFCNKHRGPTTTSYIAGTHANSYTSYAGCWRRLPSSGRTKRDADPGGRRRWRRRATTEGTCRSWYAHQREGFWRCWRRPY